MHNIALLDRFLCVTRKLASRVGVGRGWGAQCNIISGSGLEKVLCNAIWGGTSFNNWHFSLWAAPFVWTCRHSPS